MEKLTVSFEQAAQHDNHAPRYAADCSEAVKARACIVSLNVYSGTFESSVRLQVAP